MSMYSEQISPSQVLRCVEYSDSKHAISCFGSFKDGVKTHRWLPEILLNKKVGEKRYTHSIRLPTVGTGNLKEYSERCKCVIAKNELFKL